MVAIMEYEFRGDHRERGGGGLQSHSKLCNKLLYRVSNSKTKMNDAREAILALAPDNITTSLSSCFNYTQNFLKGILEARHHHEERGVLLTCPFIRLQIPQQSSHSSTFAGHHPMLTMSWTKLQKTRAIPVSIREIPNK